MGLAQARMGDPESCPAIPPCITPTGTISAMLCTRTFCNGLLVSVIGDGVSCGATTVGGSTSVFHEGIPAHRLTDANSCAGACTAASPDTFIG
ncbi:PAAR domain-containing protein [Gloeobacter morelensis]|uniref:PAAR domain-containing protein n=1 Tax=Gloeobacter morelensis MG652769 TaxID=2781736 RepID=A0ABY3PPC4_9CYAN|nr:PAAR domain-containing protein [Gloeobacter morelensis]UFP95464.1 PAAR domain-containing protein [Gloeobacter morelensis MG652769]